MVIVVCFGFFVFQLYRGAMSSIQSEFSDPYGMYGSWQENEIRPAAHEECFSVIMAADTQYPWTEPTIRGNDKTISKAWIRDYFTGMSKVNSTCQVKAIIINGDLTAFGHYSELKMFKLLLDEAKSKAKVPFFLGLGNHDYANNVHDCQNENCATGMVKYMALELAYNGMDMQITTKPNNKTFGDSFFRFFCPTPPSNIIYNGSLAYSFDIGHIHFVQLHNYPTYKTDWKSLLMTPERVFCIFDATEKFVIRPSLDWLDNDLRRARERGKHIIVCFHDPRPRSATANDTELFKRLILKYDVSGIFVGHYHDAHGIYLYDEKRYGKVPVFASGSAIYRTHLLVNFYASKKIMTVHGYSARGGESRQVFTPGDHIDYRLF